MQEKCLLMRFMDTGFQLEMEGKTMTKRALLALTLAMSTVLLTACQSSEPERFQVLTAPTQAVVVQQTQAPTTAPEVNVSESYDFDDGSYDPTSEEGMMEEIPDAVWEAPMIVTSAPAVFTAVPTMNSVYAGASPVVIDPIDKPTATPVPALTFAAYEAYDATNLNLSFEAPAGWLADSSAKDAFTVTNTDPTMSYRGFVMVSAESVSANYSKSQLTSQVKSVLNSIKGSFAGTSWSATNTASRTLLDADGIYADYSVTLSGGIKVRGRVQVACVNKKLYTVHLSCPAEYYETYKKQVYDHLRKTIKVTK